MGFALPERATAPQADPPGVTPLWLVRSVNAIAWLFVAILVMTVFLRSLDIARDKAVPLEVSHAGLWSGETWAFWFPLFAPLVLAAIALPWTAKVIIPAFCSFDWRNPRHRAPKIWCAVITFFVAIVTMTSGFPLYHGAYNERFKQEAVKLEQVDQKRASLEAEKQSIDEDLKALADSPNKYQAGAALAGAEAWKKRIAQAEADDDPQLGMIKKALSDAERGDQLRAERKKAIAAVAMAPTKAAALEQVKGAESYGSDAVVDFINAWWGFAFFIVIEMCALIAGWISYMMQMMRTQQIADYEAVHSAPVPEAGIDLRLDDHSNETQVRPQETILEEDPETGELVEKIRVRYKNEDYYRKKPQRKAKPKKDDPRAAQMFDGLSEGEQNPQSEVSDETVSGENREGEIEAGSGARILPSDVGLPDLAVADSDSAETPDAPEVYEAVWLGEGPTADAAPEPESLTHAEEDQQADEQETEQEEASTADEDFADVVSAKEFGEEDASVRDDEASNDGQADDAGDHLEDDSLAETLLPNNEGIVVWDDETDPTIKELLRKTEAAE